MRQLLIAPSILAALVLTSRVTPALDAAGTAETTRKVMISATDAKGVFVTDLTAAEITVKEGGKERQVASLRAATAPLQVMLLFDDRGTGAFQPAALEFLQKGLGHGLFAMSVLNPQLVRLTDFTDDVGAIRSGVSRLGQRARQEPDGDQLPQAIMESAKTLQQRAAERPVIVVFTIAGGQPQSVVPKHVLNTLKDTGVALNVVYVPGTDLGEIMLDGAKQSGGFLAEGGTPPLLAAAASKIVDRLLHQYVLTYTLPDGVKMSDRVAVATSRKGITLTAPTHIADK